MTYQSHSFPFEDALARTNDVYEVEFRSWGVRTTPPAVLVADPNFQYPPPDMRSLPSSLAAVAIGPRSTVDRCWLTWDRQKTLTIPSGDVTDPAAVISSPRILTVGSPLLFPQAAGEPKLLGANQNWFDAMQFGLVFAFPFGPAQFDNSPATATANRLLLGGEGTTTAIPEKFISQFGTNLLFGSPNIKEEPFLHLLLYSKLPSFSPPTKRASMLRSDTTILATSAGAYVAKYPIYGRKHVRVQFVCSTSLGGGNPAQIVDFRVGLIRNVNESLIAPALTPVIEVNAGTVLAAPAGIPVSFSIDNPCADYITLHIQNGAIGPVGCAFTMVAED